MNKAEIKKRLAELIGLSSYRFGSYKTTEGTEFKVEKMEVGMPIYVITPEGELPVPDDEYEMESGMKVKVKEGMISEIKDVETTEEEVEMAEATLVDGTKVEAEGDFEVGKPLFVITAEGERVPAPEGEHTTDSGIVVVVNAEGVITGITRPDETPEGSLEAEKTEVSMEELVDEFASMVKKLMAEIDSMKDKQEEMNQKFSKFAAEPAGEKVFDRKGYLAEKENHKFSKLEALSKLKAKK